MTNMRNMHCSKRILTALVGAALALSIAGCGGSRPQQVEVGSSSTKIEDTPSTPTDGAPVDGPTDDDWAKALGAGQAGDRILVGGPDQIEGFVNWEAVGGRTADTPLVTPIYAEGGKSSDKGTVVGYWTAKIGWIDKETWETPGYTYEKALADYERQLKNPGSS